MSDSGGILLSIVSPVYQAEQLVGELANRACDACETITSDYEIILVEDGSRDNSWEEIMRACKKFPRVKGIKFSRNFGQHYAITAGLQASRGDFVVVMDCDLQDNPDYIPELLKKLKQGFDIVYTKKDKRHHGALKNFFARMFFMAFNWLTDMQKATSDVGTYSILSRKVVNAFCRVNDSHRHYLMVIRWLGFTSSYIEVKHEKRPSGKTSYTFKKLLAHAVNGITSQSDKLLRLSIAIGFIYFATSLLGITYLLILYFMNGFKEGWASTIVLLLLSTGILLMSIGILGIYIGKIFEQVKERPLYIIDRKTNFDE